MAVAKAILSVLILTLWLAVAADAQAFSVASTETHRGNGALQVPFDKILYNDGSYSEEGHNFTCTVPGIYYMSFSAGLEAGMGANMAIHRDLLIGAQVSNNDMNTDGVGVTSRGVFDQINDGSRLRVMGQLDATHSLQGDPSTFQTTWNAFRYDDLAEADIAFSVANTNNLTSGQDPMLFDTEILNVGLQEPAYDMSTGIFTAQRGGVYFFHISAGAIEENEVRLNITGFNDRLIGSLIRTSRSHNGIDTLSRTLLVDLFLSEEVRLINIVGSELYSGAGYQTSFSGFLYATEQQTGPAFMAFLSETWRGPTGVGPLHYDIVDVNKGLGYNASNSVFTCDIVGVYFFSLSAGADTLTRVSLTLRRNADEIMRLDHKSQMHNGIDTMSRDVIVDLSFGDTVFVEVDGGTALFSDIGRQTSFLGFRIK